jgi:hypothetical protein
MIDDPCRKRQGIFDRKDFRFLFDSLANPAASSGECARFRGSTQPLSVFPAKEAFGFEQRLVELPISRIPCAVTGPGVFATPP